MPFYLFELSTLIAFCFAFVCIFARGKFFEICKWIYLVCASVSVVMFFTSMFWFDQSKTDDQNLVPCPYSTYYTQLVYASEYAIFNSEFGARLSAEMPWIPKCALPPSLKSTLCAERRLIQRYLYEDTKNDSLIGWLVITELDDGGDALSTLRRYGSGNGNTFLTSVLYKLLQASPESLSSPEILQLDENVPSWFSFEVLKLAAKKFPDDYRLKRVAEKQEELVNSAYAIWKKGFLLNLGLQLSFAITAVIILIVYRCRLFQKNSKLDQADSRLTADRMFFVLVSALFAIVISEIECQIFGDSIFEPSFWSYSVLRETWFLVSCLAVFAVFGALIWRVLWPLPISNYISEFLSNISDRIGFKRAFFCSLASFCLFVGLDFILTLFKKLVPLVGTAIFSDRDLFVVRIFSCGDVELIFVLIVLMCFVVPVLSELIFRGLVYGGIRRKYGVKFAVFASSTLFAFAPFSAELWIHYFLLGVILAFLFERTNSLRVTIVTHGLCNAVLMLSIWLQCPWKV